MSCVQGYRSQRTVIGGSNYVTGARALPGQEPIHPCPQSGPTCQVPMPNDPVLQTPVTAFKIYDWTDMHWTEATCALISIDYNIKRNVNRVNM